MTSNNKLSVRSTSIIVEHTSLLSKSLSSLVVSILKLKKIQLLEQEEFSIKVCYWFVIVLKL
jgi:hypothetical protein